MTKAKRHKDGREWRRCADCKRVKWCFYPVMDGKRDIAVCPKCWERGS